eukprot:Rmarinus@m.15028
MISRRKMPKCLEAFESLGYAENTCTGCQNSSKVQSIFLPMIDLRFPGSWCNTHSKCKDCSKKRHRLDKGEYPGWFSLLSRCEQCTLRRRNQPSPPVSFVWLFACLFVYSFLCLFLLSLCI